MKKKTFWASVCGILLCSTPALAQSLPAGLNKHLGNAAVRVDGDTLIASTGQIERKWVLTPAGLKTHSVTDLTRHRTWGKETPVACDWDLPGAIGPDSRATLVSLDVRKSDDDVYETEVLLSFGKQGESEPEGRRSRGCHEGGKCGAQHRREGRFLHTSAGILFGALTSGTYIGHHGQFFCAHRCLPKFLSASMIKNGCHDRWERV